ncbi:MAG: 50S ribosomal protein L23 [Legionellales bacterium RIFCSPHIGHO2_12_FULL_37_14]|nr:MAG: 50S ribosomal protein L23 [Legionellales bacterium RIFCSPHIGHO2_12_FULL_37_14]
MNLERILTVLDQPVISEKATRLADKNKQFVFRVSISADKAEIKAAVEHLFNVKVKSVTVLNVAGKAKRFKNSTGKRNDWKKAYVTLHENQDINFAQAE